MTYYAFSLGWNDLQYLWFFRSFSLLFFQTELDDVTDLEGEQSSVQDCFIRLMLQVGVIQSRLIIYLTERISNISRAEQENE